MRWHSNRKQSSGRSLTKEEGAEDGLGGDQRPAASQLGPRSGNNTDEIMEEPEQPKEMKRGRKKHSAKKDMKLKQTKKDDAHDDRSQLQVPASIQRHGRTQAGRRDGS
eukprot:1911837-Pyramimonas_sp.AAC.1